MEGLQLEVEVGTLRALVANGLPLPEAVAWLKRVGANPERAEAAGIAYQRELDLLVSIPVMKDPQRENWYAGPQDHHKFWPSAKLRLASRLDESTVRDIDDLTTATLNSMSAPGTTSFSDRGLVLGYVQSGKTTNFTALAAKAVDSGYKLVVVLSGLTDILREQTQARLDADLVGADGAQHWQQLTNADSDFVTPLQNAANMLVTNPSPLLAVVKKNPSRLRALRNWLASAGPHVLANTAILVIDDEADQASVNTASQGAASRINSLIREIIRAPKVSYVAYTATPFANLLINPKVEDDFYPRSFIVSMPCPKTYFGAARIFGSALDPEAEALDMVRLVDQAEVADLEVPRGDIARSRWEPQVGQGLRAAIDWFLLSTAARRVRDGRKQHATMLVHTSMLSDVHFVLQRRIASVLDDLRVHASLDADELSDGLRAFYEQECAVLPATRLGNEPVPFDELQDELFVVLEEVTTIVDNYASLDRLNYDDDEPTTAIVIGGNTLSRGLTLEGLTSSYFVRTARTYDTLMQMGRWFGYRPGYEDLCRVWLPLHLAGWFEELSQIELELRDEIDRYALEGLTPLEAGVRIRLHPSLAVTAANKMRYAVLASFSYAGTRPQTTIFARTDATWLKSNLEATRRLLEVARSAEPLSGLAAGLTGFDNVRTEDVLRFVRRYEFHPNKPSLSSELLAQYIGEERDAGGLGSWRVVVMGQAKSQRRVQLADGVEAGVVSRSRLATDDDSVANLRALTAGDDHWRTLTEDEWGDDTPSEQAYGAKRNQVLPRDGILRIYVIDADSRASVGALRRVNLDAAEDVVGLAFDFPWSVRPDAGASHVASALEVRELDWEEELASEELVRTFDAELKEDGQW